MRILRLAPVAVLVAVAACGGGGAVDAEPVTVPAASADLGDAGAWWADGVLHVGEAEMKVKGLGSFVIADRTVAFVDAKGLLCLSDLADTSCTDYEPYGDLVVSPDGNRLGFLDGAHGEKDEYDTRQLVATVLDLTSGDVLSSSTDGMGDPGEDDLADLYEDGQPTFRGFTASGEPVVDGAGEAPSSEVIEPRDVLGQAVRLQRRGDDVQVVPGAIDNTIEAAHLSPDASFLVAGTEDADDDLRGSPAPRGTLRELTGQRDPWYTFGTWSGPHEFLATTDALTTTRSTLQRCDAETLTCEPVQQIEGGVDSVIFPTTAGTDVQDLGGM